MKTRAPLRGNGVLSGIGYLALVAVLALAAVNLYRPLRDGFRLNRDISAARTRLDELQVLYPLYAELAGLDRPAQWPGLALPVPRKLSESDVTAIPERFMALATRSRLQLSVVSPRVETDAGDHRYLAVELHASGPYRQLQAFLMELAQLPVLERIERLEVQREALHEEFNVVTRLALEGGAP
ncbi:MAG: hypothetical protein AB7V22_08000 [Kiritimatiellia bacterium]